MPTVPELKDALAGQGVDVPAGAKKAELEALVADPAVEAAAVEASVRDALREAAVLGVHRGVVSQWVDEVWGALQGERVAAVTADEADPHPLLGH